MTSLVAVLALAAMHQNHEVISPWPHGAPGSESRQHEPETAPHPWSIAHIYDPSLTVYLPPSGMSTGVAALIAPGGGHSELVVNEEGVKPAHFLNTLGITAFVLKYRLFREEGSGLTFETAAVADTFRAMRYLRAHASDFAIDPNKIGMIGFSAGGENLSAAAFGPGMGDPGALDPIDRQDERPNFAAWIYPGGLGIPNVIPPNSPTAFMLVASDDDHVASVLQLVDRYRKAKLTYEVHILNGGQHGFNMGDRSKLRAVNTWPQRLGDWLRYKGFAQ
jgi:acetyl esterase/lipase